MGEPGLGSDGIDRWMAADEVWGLPGEAGGNDLKHLVNTAPLPDSSIGPETAATLQEGSNWNPKQPSWRGPSRLQTKQLDFAR